MNYEYICPDCKKGTSGSTTADYDFSDAIECPWCGRVSRITNITCHFELEQTNKKSSPTKLEELEALKRAKV
jgi:DNA-directed RNA polymerase subunit RPC12/RpoP